jgi:hypothetical protein
MRSERKMQQVQKRHIYIVLNTMRCRGLRVVLWRVTGMQRGWREEAKCAEDDTGAGTSQLVIAWQGCYKNC